MRSNLILFVLVLVLALVLANQNFTGYKGEDEYDDEGGNCRAKILPRRELKELKVNYI